MKITEVKVWLVEGVKYNWTLLEIFTDTGHTGVGEATNWPGSPIIEVAAFHAGERIVGLDPLRTDFIWQKLSAISIGSARMGPACAPSAASKWHCSISRQKSTTCRAINC